MKILILILIIISYSMTGYSAQSYPIESSIDDETLIINGEVFKSKTYCMNFEKDDQVVFIEGSALGACVTAKIFNKRTNQICDLWCE